MTSSFQTAKAKHAFIDRCPSVFMHFEALSEADILMRQICALLLETYFEVEKFRDITLAQVMAILDKTLLKELNMGYLVISGHRTRSIQQFVEDYLIRKKKPEENPMFCSLLGPFQNSYDYPWSSPTDRRSVIDYLQFVRPESKELFVNMYSLCNYRTFGCRGNRVCTVTVLKHPHEENEENVIGIHDGWKITFVSNTDVTLTYEYKGKTFNLPSGTFRINKVGDKRYTLKSNLNGTYLEADNHGNLNADASAPGKLGIFKIFSEEICKPLINKNFEKSKPRDWKTIVPTWEECGSYCVQEKTWCFAWSWNKLDKKCNYYDGNATITENTKKVDKCKRPNCQWRPYPNCEEKVERPHGQIEWKPCQKDSETVVTKTINHPIPTVDNAINDTNWISGLVNCNVPKPVTECMTAGGEDPNKKCVFPFVFNGKTYHTCTTTLSFTTDKFQCATKVDSNKNLKSSGDCGSNCVMPDVRLGKNDMAEIRVNGKWTPICGHYFWDKQYGANLFCQKLGWKSGEFGKKITLPKNANPAIRIGTCEVEDTSLEACSGQCNDQTTGGDTECGNCEPGARES